MEKIIRLAKSLPDYNGDSNTAALITSGVNRQYFTTFPSSSGLLLVTKEKSYFLTDFRYIEAAKAAINPQIECIQFSSPFASLSTLLEKHGVTNLYFEDESLTLSELRDYQQRLPDSHFIEDVLCGLIKDMRLVKSAEALENIVKAQKITDEAFTHILNFIKVGVTENEVALELEFFMRKQGAERVAFDTIAVSGKNSSKPHGVPSDKKLESGDFLTMDFGAVVNGWHSDMTRTVAVGGCSDKQQEIYEIVLQAQLNTLSGIAAGVKCSYADSLARDIISSAGYGDCFGHGTGHGVGLEIHEEPRVSPSAGDELLLAGSIVTVEPGIYIPNEFGVRIEDMVYVTENGCNNLTKSKKELIIL